MVNNDMKIRDKEKKYRAYIKALNDIVRPPVKFTNMDVVPESKQNLSDLLNPINNLNRTYH